MKRKKRNTESQKPWQQSNLSQTDGVRQLTRKTRSLALRVTVMSDNNNSSKGFIDTDSPEEVTHKSNLCNSGAPFDESQRSGTGDRDELGRWKAGNRGAFVHGGRSKEVLRNLTQTDDAVERLAEHRREIVKDTGASVGRIKSDLIGRYCELDALANFMANDLASRGALTSRGRSRAVLNAYVAIVDRQVRIALALGLERRQKSVSLSQQLRGDVE